MIMAVHVLLFRFLSICYKVIPSLSAADRYLMFKHVNLDDIREKRKNEMKDIIDYSHSI